MTTLTSSFAGTALPASQTRTGRAGRSSSVRVNAIFSKFRKQDKAVVERAKKSEVVKAKKLLPFDQKVMDIGPERGRKANEARNKVREGGFGAGRPYQSVKIGQKMEGTRVPSNIDPVFFAVGLSGVTVALAAGLILSSQ